MSKSKNVNIVEVGYKENENVIKFTGYNRVLLLIKFSIMKVIDNILNTSKSPNSAHEIVVLYQGILVCLFTLGKIMLLRIN